MWGLTGELNSGGARKLCVFLFHCPSASICHCLSSTTVIYSLWCLTPGWEGRRVSVKIEKNKMFQFNRGFPGWAGKESTCNAGDLGSIPGLGRFPWRRERLPTPVFWPGDFHGLYSQWDREELDTTEWCSLSLFLAEPRCGKGTLFSFQQFSKEMRWQSCLTSHDADSIRVCHANGKQPNSLYMTGFQGNFNNVGNFSLKNKTSYEYIFKNNMCPLQYSCLEKSMDRGAWRAPWGYMTEHVCMRVEGDGLVATKW